MDLPAEHKFNIRPEGSVDFTDLPWHLSLKLWEEKCDRLINLPRGISRHTVVFVKYDQDTYAIKELPVHVAKIEYDNLVKMEKLNLPSVIPVGYFNNTIGSITNSILITKYLNHSIPYHQLFSRTHLIHYRGHLLDAMSGLLVQLHLAGIYWGDCSLSNTLFKRDAGFLQAYLVDAETSQVFPHQTQPINRYNDLQIMEYNLDRDLSNINISDGFGKSISGETTSYVRQKYHSLWDEITKDINITDLEYYKIQERIKNLNELGFSVGEIEITKTEKGENFYLHAVVTDRFYHRNQLCDLTGLCTEEMQARSMMNEIYELQARLSQQNNAQINISQAALYWLDHCFLPAENLLKLHIKTEFDSAELYCQILENKWYLSERAGQDVGLTVAIEDYIENYLNIRNN